jgi:hypothetical protein
MQQQQQQQRVMRSAAWLAAGNNARKCQAISPTRLLSLLPTNHEWPG